MIQLSDQFLNLVQQQLSSFGAENSIKQVVVYVAKSKEGDKPSLESVGEWPSLEKALPAVEADQELRFPSPNRRWYPLQEGNVLLGVLRAEINLPPSGWPDHLDSRIKALAIALTNSLSLELDRSKLVDELGQQREQISLMCINFEIQLQPLGLMHSCF